MPAPIRSAEPAVPFEREALAGSIPDLFARQATRHGVRPAVCAADGTLDYADLDRLSNRIARAILARRGVAAEPVALLLGQGAALAPAILGILKAGRFYVPLDPTDADERLHSVLEDVGAPLLLTSEAGMERVRSLRPNTLERLDVGTLQRARGDDAPVGTRSGPDSLAYVFYTSGSTGRPKGVMDTHRNVLHNVMRYTNTLGLGPRDRLTLLQRASFSGSVSSLFGALLNGAAVHPFDLAEEGPRRLAERIEREAITVYHSVPSIFRLIAAEGGRFRALRWVRLEGDRVTPADVELFQRHFPPGCRLVNGFGATECGLVSQLFLDHASTIPRPVVPVGRQAPDVELRVLDAEGRALGPGHTGEVAVRSRYLATGYWKRPDLTARAFRADPEGAGLRLYRTGDRGRLEADGTLVHLGRSDGAVKVRGSVVEPAAVEAAILAAATDLTSCAVVAREGIRGETELLAYLVGPTPEAGALRRALRAALPAPAVPARFVTLDALPLTEHGKVDRRRLAQLAPPPAAQPAQPCRSDDVEGRLRVVFGELLARRDVQPDDDFFDLGGDSLRALELLVALEHEFGCGLAPAELLGAPTPRRLATRVAAPADATPERVVALRTGGSQPPLFLVPGAVGSALGLRALARRLGADQSVYAFEPAGLAGHEEADASVEDMAVRYLDALHTACPTGPVRLAGTCLGSLVAFEMARRLAAKGRPVDRLLLLGDALLPDWVTRDTPRPGAGLVLGDALRRAVYHLRHTPLDDVVRSAWSEAGLRLRPGRRRYRAVLQAHHWARARYRPGPYPGPILYLRLGIRPRSKPSEVVWARLAAGGLTCRDVRVVSDRWQREPHVRTVAAALRPLLAEEAHAG